MPAAVARAAAVLGTLAFAALFAGTAFGNEPANADTTTTPDRRFALGLSFGSPQSLAVTAEVTVRPGIHLQVNAGTLIIVTSGSVRAIAVPETMKIAPYLFLGGGGVYILPLDGGEEGFSSYTWWGVGVRLRAGRFHPFLEVGEVGNLNRNHGYEERYPAAAAGFLITL
jgi:hypothetical protein